MSSGDEVEFRLSAYCVVEPVVLDQIGTEVLGKVLDNHIVKYFDAGNNTTKFSKTFLSTGSFVASITKFIHGKTMDAIVDHFQAAAFDSTLLTYSFVRIADSSTLQASNRNPTPEPPSRLSSAASLKVSKRCRKSSNPRRNSCDFKHDAKCTSSQSMGPQESDNEGDCTQICNTGITV